MALIDTSYPLLTAAVAGGEVTKRNRMISDMAWHLIEFDGWATVEDAQLSLIWDRKFRAFDAFALAPDARQAAMEELVRREMVRSES